MEWNETSEVVDGAWVAVPEVLTYTRGFFLTDQTYGVAWQHLSEVNGCLDEFIVTYPDGSSEGESTHLEWGEDGSTTMTVYEKSWTADAGGSVTAEDILQRDGDLVVYPEGTKMRQGDAFTFRVTVTETTYPDASVSNDQYIYTRDFFNAGRFYVEWIDGTAQRSLQTP